MVDDSFCVSEKWARPHQLVRTAHMSKTDDMFLISLLGSCVLVTATDCNRMCLCDQPSVKSLDPKTPIVFPEERHFTYVSVVYKQKAHLECP